MTPKVAFRVDATDRIGTGHFMRCLTLATALHGRDAHVRFVSRNLPPHFIRMVEQRGIQVVALQGGACADGAGDIAYSAWLGTTQDEDAAQTIDALRDHRWNWIVVDHYALDARWESAVRGVTARILAIDDLADRRHDCDLLLDQNHYEDMSSRYAGKVPEHCRMLLGPRHALLRPEFSEIRRNVRPRTGAVNRILVFFGGVDAGNFTGQAIQALSLLQRRDLQVDVVIGVQHPNRQEIEQACSALGYACHVNTPRMAALTAQADLAIAAGGSAVWERCCLGLPALTLCTAENQRRQVLDAAAHGLLYAPTLAAAVADLLALHTAALLDNPALLRWLSSHGMNVVDGQGVDRCIADMGILGPASNRLHVTVRPATYEDAILVWPWRNAESTRRHSFDPSPVPLDKHMDWWRHSLANAGRALLIGEHGSQAIGVLRLDFGNAGSACVSIYLDPAVTGRGIGQTLIAAGVEWLRKHRPDTTKVEAHVLQGNAASQKAFQAAGFAESHKVLARKP